MEVTKKIAQKIIDASKMLKSRADDNAFDSSDVCVIDGICKALNAYAYDLINRAKVQPCFSKYHTLFLKWKGEYSQAAQKYPFPSA